MPETLDQLEAQLGDDLRALAADPDPAFVRRVTAPRRRERRSLVPALGLAASLLVALVVAAGALSLRGDDERAPVGASAGDAAQEELAQPQGGTAADGGPEPGAASTAPVPPPASASDMPLPLPAEPPPGAARQVERSAEATVAVEDPQGAADDVARVAERAGGFVASSSVSSGTGGGAGSIVLRVPTVQLDRVVARLRDVGDVTGLQRDATDITNVVAGAERLLSDARDARAALRRALRRATDPARIDALRARLDRAGRLVERREARLTAERRRASLATLVVTLTTQEDGAWAPSDAPGDAWRVLGAVAGAVLIGLAAAAPVLALLAAIVLARRLRRWRLLAG